MTKLERNLLKELTDYFMLYMDDPQSPDDYPQVFFTAPDELRALLTRPDVQQQYPDASWLLGVLDEFLDLYGMTLIKSEVADLRRTVEQMAKAFDQ